MSWFPRWPSLLQQNKSRLGHVQEKELHQNQWWCWWWWGWGGVYQYSGAGYITVSSRTQDRNTPSARTHRTHGKADSTQNTRCWTWRRLVRFYIHRVSLKKVLFWNSRFELFFYKLYTYFFYLTHVQSLPCLVTLLLLYWFFLSKLLHGYL